MANTTENVENATASFRKLVLASYELDDAFVDSICGFYQQTVKDLLASLPAPKARGRAAAKETTVAVEQAEAAPKKERAKGSRKKSPYNIFVREMMKTAEIQSLDHKQKMSAIANKWKSLDDAGKAPYTQMANEENDAKSGELALAEDA